MRGPMPREYYIPKNALKVTAKECDAVAYYYTNSRGQVFAMGFGGKRSKPDFHFFYGQGEQGRQAAQQAVTRYFDGQRAQATRKAERRQTTPHNLNVGDVLYTSWGYDQTNVEFYQVTRIVGEKTIEVREIGTEIEETGSMQGRCRPRVGAFLEKSRTLTVRALIQHNSLRVTIEGHSASLTSPERTHYYSSYA